MLSPQTVPKTKPYRRQAHEKIFDLAAGDLAPWETGHPLLDEPLPHRYTWRFTAYGGLYPLAAVSETLVKAFGQDTREERPSEGDTALFALTIDADGCLVENGATLSACAWALGKLTSAEPAPEALDGFDDVERAFSSEMDGLVPPDRRATDEEPDGSTTPGPFDRIVRAFGQRLKSAGMDAWSAGAEAAGTAVKTVAETAVGPVVGDVAGAAAGAFTESVLGPGDDGEDGEESGSATETPSTPRLLVTASALHAFVDEMAAALGVRDSLGARGVRIRCQAVPNRDDSADQTFLNSHIADDLNHVAAAVAADDVGPALRDYLTDERSIGTAHRIDVRTNPDAVIAAVEPQHIPAGRWPGDPAKPLVLSQQFAVNRVLAELRDNPGIFSVNGPPGTGKTTLLRDVVAGIVVDRANRLAELGSPAEGFTDRIELVPVGPKKYQIPVHGVSSALSGFEIVLATATNDAAKNVSAEVPGVDAVRGYAEEALGADYFAELASHVLDSDAWGLVSATLGNLQYRNTFAKRFWWADYKSTQNQDGTKGMYEMLKEAEDDPDSAQDWETAVAEFRRARAEVERLANTRQRAAESITAVAACRRQWEEARRAFADADALCALVRDDLAAGNVEVTRADGVFRDADGDYESHLRHRPGLWVSLATWFRAPREWQAKHEQLEEARDAAKKRLRDAETSRDQFQQRLNVKTAERQKAEEARAAASYELDRALGEVTRARENWPGHLPIPDDFAGDEEFQKCAPWADEEYVTARNRLFLQALRLHRAFVLRSGPRLRNNLSVMTEILQGNVRPSPAARLAAWQSLFLVVPMVSTTFASLPRLFTGLGRESLGWLLVDEAGQATPQQVVGGLWRCQRAVVVGDPQQLEPIVALPDSAQHALRRHHRVDEEWTPETTSAQGVADRLTRHGTALPVQDGDEQVWVGAPLRVHRRCDRPMFDVSNDIAYGGTLMVYATRHDGEFPGENRWIDVQSATSEGHWIEDEGDALTDLFVRLSDQRIALDDVRVISPFRDVVTGAKKRLRAQIGPDFAKHNVGTVHTVQGKESDVIVLVLGGDPRRHGARQWAASRPNLLNVAVSRAKRRFYVIGNRKLWKDLRYFDRLAGAFPAHEWE
ncbi:DEAD/DEAH box helicase [Saccharopolyspora flava]|uniref:AAA domain-containing protein n=1 Tax=Saccharopolyspora flava TaxID=95161 RepID=A0A1I6UCU7_9PSEU|nr:DEAD/DEAH box helicase [Saccharopolyspora flava]SFS99309.1 AAA domain-containing protein [Saccharopolyspora flava]